MTKNRKGAGATVGLAAAALAAAAAGIYYFYGSEKAQKHRKAMKGWAVKAKGEVMQRLEKVRNLDRESYNNAVDKVLKRYRGMKDVGAAEVMALGRELKGHWNNIKMEMEKQGKNGAKKNGRSR